jgi:hypothetical protein
MEIALVIFIPLVIGLLLKAVSNRSSSKVRRPAPTVVYEPPTFRVVALGASGAGKTVFLASLFHKLNFRVPGRSYYLQTEPQERVALARLYRQVSDTAQPWPKSTRVGESREFTFDCVGVDEANTQHKVLRLKILDYPGEVLVEGSERNTAALQELVQHIEDAHALLGMIDGYRVLQLLKGERAGHTYFQHSLQPMFGLMQSASCPIHLVLTKWDLVREFAGSPETDDGALLDRVIGALMRFEHIKALVYVYSKSQVVRLIPVSAVGAGFADLDGHGEVVKRADGEMRPTNVEVPLCAVLPDLFKQAEHALSASAQESIDAAIATPGRKDARALAADALNGRLGTALRIGLQGALGRDVGYEVATVFVEWLRGPRQEQPDPGAAPTASAAQLADVQRVRGRVLDDFNKTILRMDALLPNAQLSVGW